MEVLGSGEMVGRVGIEPTTNLLRVGFSYRVFYQ